MSKKQPHQLSRYSPAQYFIPLVILLLVLLGGDPLAAALGLPEMTMEHLPGLLFTPGQLLTLDVRIDDLAGIIAARCYFRYQPTGDYVYVDLGPTGDKDYRATLPAPAESVPTVEYFFLAVNGAHQVVRSPAFTLQRDALARPVTSGPGQEAIEIRTEGAISETFAASLAQPDTVRVAAARERERFGLVAGVNFASVQSGSGLVEGYFGGFQLEAKGKPVPVKGLTDFSSPVQPSTSTTAAQAGADIVGPPIAGKWHGRVFIDYNTDGVYTPGLARSLTAEITQVGNKVTIVTSLTWTRPKSLVGTMNADGHMLLYDEIDEDWSTHYGPATSTHMVLGDYVSPPSMDNHYPPILVVELWRELPPAGEPPPSILPGVYQLLLHNAPR